MKQRRVAARSPSFVSVPPRKLCIKTRKYSFSFRLFCYFCTILNETMKRMYETPAAETIPMALQENFCQSPKGDLPDYNKKPSDGLVWDD